MIGLAPPLKYGPTGVVNTRNMYSSAGLTPITGFVPIIYGRTYKVAPEPYGGTYAALAFTVCTMASTKRSSGNTGISSLDAESIIRSALAFTV